MFVSPTFLVAVLAIAGSSILDVVNGQTFQDDSATDPNARKPVAKMYFPVDRFVAWNEITNADYKANATALGWDEKTWNKPGSLFEDLEQYSFWSLEVAQRQRLNGMLLRANTWDCFINHYEDYDWDEMVDEDIAKYWEGLGWTESSWNGESDEPESEGLDWEELTSDEQEYATEVCYFEELWDELELEDWP